MADLSALIEAFQLGPHEPIAVAFADLQSHVVEVFQLEVVTEEREPVIDGLPVLVVVSLEPVGHDDDLAGRDHVSRTGGPRLDSGYAPGRTAGLLGGRLEHPRVAWLDHE